MKHLATGIAGLNEALQRSALTVQVGPGDDADINGAHEVLPLTDTIIEWYRCAAPLAFEIPWSVEWLTLYGPGDLVDRQAGYRWINGAEKLDDQWNTEWVVIGDCSADPIIADTSKQKTPVLMAMHGSGCWDTVLIAPSLGLYLQVLAHWVDTFTENDGRIRDEDGELLADFLGSLRKQLSGIVPAACINNLCDLL